MTQKKLSKNKRSDKKAEVKDAGAQRYLVSVCEPDG